MLGSVADSGPTLNQHWVNVLCLVAGICILSPTPSPGRSRALFCLLNIVGSFRDRELACSASDSQGSIFESCVWRAVSPYSSHHPQEVLQAQFILYVYKGGLKPPLI